MNGEISLIGTVLEREGAVYRVSTSAGEVQAVLRGKTKRGTPKVIVGDVVHLEPEPQGDLYAIHAVADRRSLLARRVPEGRGERPIVANVDQVLVMTASQDPPPIPQLIDRLLVIAEANRLAPVLVVNKIDLALADDLIHRYRDAGYTVFPTSATTGDGVEAVHLLLKGRASVITGPSGVGKTSLLNAIQPGLKLRVGEVSSRVRRGRHTTVSSIMIPLADGGYLVDTPGFSEVGLWGLPPRALGECFPEFGDYHDGCRFADCVHRQEPDCAIREAVEEGRIDGERYRSYLTLLEELEAAPKAWE
ncbi:MAG: ribosome small subunit-dependent GTPase A [Gemmatimonadales bacterium]